MHSLKLNEKTYNIIVAENLPSWKEGLKGDKLSTCDGLLMVFPDSRVINITMVDMLYSLDIAWIDESMKIIKKVENFSPFDSQGNPNQVGGVLSKYLLELRAGEFLKAGVKIGNSIEYK